ncbi:GMC family oxidoreductase N-terminal domain-containing protein [Corallococcus exiguus]|uniref:GMC family oxidoreductase N-terminal domain-containing protein n=1 Tax=Corallococcus exiguus TaxID=83462 RepID=UPI00155F6276|nr:GMC family oxidoreductase N-terminal domain-containing protein [Corallococcus exiguus]NRD47062.1 GMC family oxidoreductase [Corallococcus exiguus]
MRRLSSPWSELASHYPVVVVGSGYGGGITASRLSRAGQQVCVLERGREMHPGEMPRTPAQAVAEFQLHCAPGQGDLDVGSPTGLIEVHRNGDVSVIDGCGLGGTSLINAGVTMRPDPRVFEDPRWPQALRADVHGLLEDGFAHAELMLRPLPYPEDHPPLQKLKTFGISAEKLGGRLMRPPVAVTFEAGVNAAGVRQPGCSLCGDCATGCNTGAKNTVLMNYLPDAHAHGARIFTEVSVRAVVPDGTKWRVYYRPLNTGRERFDAPDAWLTADRVVLAAGTMGTAEILLRSRELGLPVSSKLGHRFSSNGDVLAFGYNLDMRVHGVGHGEQNHETRDPVGPCIAGVIDQRDTARLDEGMIIEEGVIPGALASLMPAALAGAAALVGEDTDEGILDWVQERLRQADSFVRGPDHGAVEHTQTLMVMSHDEGKGELRLEHDRVRLHWPDAGRDPQLTRIEERLRRATAALGGTFVRYPLWSEAFGKELLCTHPLGGCVMAERAEDGVVDHEGRVFSGASGHAVHEGLYVSDGSVVPRSLGINPLLTISAVAERACALMARRHGWTIDYAPLPEASAPQAPGPVGVRFTETMHGFLSGDVKAPHLEAGDPERDDATPLRFVLTVTAEDLNATLRDERHPLKLMGTVTAPVLSSRPLVVTRGELRLMTREHARPGGQRMEYLLHLLSEAGEPYYLEGYKDLYDDPGLDLWKDTTTLFVSLHRGDGPEAPCMGRGFLRLSAEEFARQLTTLRVLNARDSVQRAEALARFGGFFFGALWDTYVRRVAA